MTQRIEGLTLEPKVVVVFDICSSSKMLEDLMLSENLKALRNLLISIKKYLREKSDEGVVEVYKFIGDGWILLFPETISGENLITFMEDLSRFFGRELSKTILPRLQARPAILGLTFGIDSGSLIRIVMMENPEYIGRPLNIASRLQGAIKQGDKNPAYKALFSRPCFEALRVPPLFRKYREVTRELDNIQGGEDYACVKMILTL